MPVVDLLGLRESSRDALTRRLTDEEGRRPFRLADAPLIRSSLLRCEQTDQVVLSNMHHWPVWGNDEINHHLRLQRDMYRYINDETLRLANHGYTMVEIAEMFQMPAAIDKHFSNRGYYGSVNHNVKATYVLYLGWFIGNPATLHVLPPVESSKRYVDMMGGADALISKAKDYYDKGEYRWVAEVVNHAVFADPSNQAAKNLQADALLLLQRRDNVPGFTGPGDYQMAADGRLSRQPGARLSRSAKRDSALAAERRRPEGVELRGRDGIRAACGGRPAVGGNRHRGQALQLPRRPDGPRKGRR